MDPFALVLALVLGCCCILCMLSSSIGGFWKCTGGSMDPIDFDVNMCTTSTGGAGQQKSARYVRLQQTTKKAIKIAELGVFNVDGLVSVDKKVTVSSKLEGFSLQNLTMGAIPMDSVAGTTDSTESEYVEVDLGEETDIIAVAISNAPDTPDGVKGCKFILYDRDHEPIAESSVIELESDTVKWSVFESDAETAPTQTNESHTVSVNGRFVKLTHTNPANVINLALVNVIDETGTDLANGKTTTSNSVHPAGPMVNLTDGKKDNFAHTNGPADVNDWMEIDLGATHAISNIVIHNRADCCKERATGIQVSILDENKDIVSRTPLIPDPPKDKYTYIFVNGKGAWV